MALEVSEIGGTTLAAMPQDLLSQAAKMLRLLLAQPEEDDITYGELFSLYMSHDVLPRGKRVDNFQYFYNKHGQQWAAVPVNRISTLDLLQWRTETSAQDGSGPIGAQRALDTMAAMFNWGMTNRAIKLDKNPCKGIPRLQAKPRERFLSLTELEDLDRALSEESPLFQDFFYVCVLTGARKGNVLAMRWASVDLQAGIWHLHADEHKNREAQGIPLTEPVIAMLKAKKSKAPQYEGWVFPSPKGNGHLKDVRRAWSRVCARAGFDDARIHDLRRTLGSHMAIAGESAYIIGRMLGHRDHRSTAVYARLNLEPVRQAVEGVHGKWRKSLALPMTPPVTREQAPPAPLQPRTSSHATETTETLKNTGKILSAAEMIVAEGKVLAAIRSGARTRKGFYRKFPGKWRLNAGELTRLIDGLVERGLIEAYRDEGAWHHWRYRIKDDATSQGRGQG